MSLSGLFIQYCLSAYHVPFSLLADQDTEEIMIDINQQGVMWEDVNKSCAGTITFHTISSRTEKAGASGLKLGQGKIQQRDTTFFFVNIKS